MLFSLLLTSLVASTGDRVSPIRAGSVDHTPLLSMEDQATMLAPDRERWAIAVLDSVGERREQTYPDGGRWDVFDLDLHVIDGLNVARGPLHVFWNEDDTHRRIPLLQGMVGARVLLRLAPTEKGRFLIVSGVDEDPQITPTFAVGARPLLSLLLPTEARTLDPGLPAERRFFSLWRAGASLSPSAYAWPFFERYVGAAIPPITSRSQSLQVRDADGWLVDEGRVPGTDVVWLRRFAGGISPTFRMLAEENLRRNEVQGWNQAMKAIVERSLREPAAFPDGVFVGVVSPKDLRSTDPNVPWPPFPPIVAALAKRPSARLTIDLLALLSVKDRFVPDRERLLPLLGTPDPSVRRRTLRAFDLWHGQAPAGTDPLAWHRSRAKLGLAELQAAMTPPGG